VVRPHPQGDKEAYDILRSQGIILDSDLDLTANQTSPDMFNCSAIRHMAAFLTDAEFVISSWGTTVLLEACIFNVPAIQLRWMDAILHKNPAEVQMVRDFQRYIHMRAFDAEGARLYCDSPHDLNEVLERLKNDTCVFQSRRIKTVRRLVCLPLAKVTDRICSGIENLLSNGRHDKAI
jgi:hypothetical protein